jgi:RHS repeat-associated protein
MPYTEEQDPDLDTTDTVDPNANYQPPDTPEPEPTPPPDDYSDLPGGGGPPPDLPGGRSVTYYWDRVGNRTELSDSANGGATYTLNNINQYTSAAGSAVTNGSEHEISDYQSNHYTYINDERLKRVTSGNNAYDLYYDALGRCVKRVLNTTTTTYYIYDGEKPILEYKSNDLTHPVKNVYGKGIDEILTRTETGINSGQPFYYCQDHEGSVTHLLNSSGNKIETYKYDAFGAPTFYNGADTQIVSTAFNNRFLFTGREYAATYRGTYVAPFKFYEYRARAYNPTLGRFMSEDPKLFDAGDYNLFRYCHNDPIDFTDPMGLESPAWAQAAIPGVYEYDRVVANVHAGNYGMAAGWFATMLVQQYVGVVTAGRSTQAQASARAVRAAMAERQAIVSATSSTAKTRIASLTGFYPGNAGFVGPTKQVFLMPGQIIDRYGGGSYSRFFSPPGTPNWARALPPGTASQSLRSFEVVKPFEVQSGKVGAWFHQPGGGMQYQSPVKLETLLKRGIVKEITPQ